jgi:hypothetical protein
MKVEMIKGTWWENLKHDFFHDEHTTETITYNYGASNQYSETRYICSNCELCEFRKQKQFKKQ